MKVRDIGRIRKDRLLERGLLEGAEEYFYKMEKEPT